MKMEIKWPFLRWDEVGKAFAIPGNGCRLIIADNEPQNAAAHPEDSMCLDCFEKRGVVSICVVNEAFSFPGATAYQCPDPRCTYLGYVTRFPARETGSI